MLSRIYYNKRKRIPKEQSTIDNPEKLATQGTHNKMLQIKYQLAMWQMNRLMDMVRSSLVKWGQTGQDQENVALKRDTNDNSY